MNAAYTPGPWVFDEENDGGIYGNNMRTYVGAAVKLGTDEGAANAFLIAAAPDLLDALQLLEKLLLAGQPPGSEDLEQARTAIAKATSTNTR